MATSVIIDPTLVDANNKFSSNAATIIDLNKQNGDLTEANSLLEQKFEEAQASIADLTFRKSFFDLQQCPMFPQDKKIPFQWIQPGNTGNTGGGAPVPHGTSTWLNQADGSAKVTANPVKLPGGKSDNFLFYMVLPYPHSRPNRFFFDCDQFNAASESDWKNSQQLECWDELIDDGFQYTMNWACNPTQGLQYFDRSLNKWIQFMPLGKPILVDLGVPTNWSFVSSIDRVKHTVLYEELIVGTTTYEVNKLCNAIAKTGSQLSTSIQMDGKANAPSYSAILDKLKVSYE